MKNNNQRGILLGIALLGATTFVGLGTPAQAQPGQHKREVKDDRRDVRDAQKDVKQEKRDVIRADTPQQRRQQTQQLLDAQKRLDREKRDLRNDNYKKGGDFRHDNRDNDHRNNDYRDNDHRNNNRPVIINRPVIVNRPGYGRPGYNRPGGGYEHRTIRGTIVNYRSRDNFDVRSGNTTYNVDASSHTPRALSRGDYVEVSGDLRGGRELRNANVSLLKNR